MSLRDGRAKMSKSDESDKSRINLIDSKEQILLKLQKCKTDSVLPIEYEPETRPGGCLCHSPQVKEKHKLTDTHSICI